MVLIQSYMYVQVNKDPYAYSIHDTNTFYLELSSVQSDNNLKNAF